MDKPIDKKHYKLTEDEEKSIKSIYRKNLVKKNMDDLEESSKLLKISLKQVQEASYKVALKEVEVREAGLMHDKLHKELQQLKEILNKEIDYVIKYTKKVRWNKELLKLSVERQEKGER